MEINFGDLRNLELHSWSEIICITAKNGTRNAQPIKKTIGAIFLEKTCLCLVSRRVTIITRMTT